MALLTSAMGQLEIIYASALAEGRLHLAQDEETYIQERVDRDLKSIIDPSALDTNEGT